MRIITLLVSVRKYISEMKSNALTYIMIAVFLMLNTVYFYFMLKEFERIMLEEKYIELVNAVETYVTGTTATPENTWDDYETNIIAAVKHLDDIEQIYGACYKEVNGEKKLITPRHAETSLFEPFDYPDLVKAINSQSSGRIIITYAPEKQSYRDLHVYFKWFPHHLPKKEQYLVLVGVSRYAIQTKLPFWIQAGQWGSIIVIFCIVIWFLFMMHKLREKLLTFMTTSNIDKK